MPIRLIALDVDGTLVRPDNTVSDPVRAAIDSAANAGLIVALSTGRRRRTARAIADQLSPPVPMVCLGGSLVKDHADDTLLRMPFTAAELSGVVALARALDEAAILQLDGNAHDFLVDAEPTWNLSTQAYSDRFADCSTPGDAMQSRPEDVLVISFFGPDATMQVLGQRIRHDFPELAVTLVPEPDQTYCEVTQPGIDKWHGLSHLIRHLGISAQEVCAIGDQVNDLPMLRQAGMSYAMANAPAAVQAEARRTTASNLDDGVAVAIREILKETRDP